MSAVSQDDDAKEYITNNSDKRVKFEKMVAMSQELYNSDVFKNKSDRSKRRKLRIK